MKAAFFVSGEAHIAHVMDTIARYHDGKSCTSSVLDPERRYDLVHSYIVLQHIRPKQGYQINANLLNRFLRAA